eukprot:CAMPEP_0195529146 /NCGR_PEP_ID=MMETSP0794_2-20130614/31585_1 /TAXON_ID=515487 /ORGANISM="Stephanopyxis turris, Strain CCMP 815" /LENGTH=340 /DNA_ID=CAMNT_0040660401 /DNA_START=1 /DNA_END=1020 /DNA_ORIENTATION=-
MTSKRRLDNNDSNKEKTDNLFSTISRLDSDDIRSSKHRRTSTASTLSKAKAAKSQTELYSKLVEIRILMQRNMQQMQVLFDLTDKTQRKGGDNSEGSSSSSDDDDDENTTAVLKDVQSAGQDLMNQLMAVRTHMIPSLNEDASSSDDEETNIDTEEEEEEEKKLQSDYEKCRKSWKTILNQRHHDLKLKSGVLTMKTKNKFQVLDQELWDQIQATLSHEQLMKDTASVRNDENSHDDADDEKTEDLKEQEDNFDNSALFDDSKVYQHLLRDFIANGSSKNNGAAERRLRSLQKKKRGGGGADVDRKASKGRKIRYTVHPKLTNFTFPIARPAPAINDGDW